MQYKIVLKDGVEEVFTDNDLAEYLTLNMITYEGSLSVTATGDQPDAHQGYTGATRYVNIILAIYAPGTWVRADRSDSDPS